MASNRLPRMSIGYDHNFSSPSDYELTEQILQTKLDTHVKGASKYYVGKTYIREKTGRRFNVFDPQTWDKSGILNRERDHRRRFGNNSKMIILGLITTESLPDGVSREQLQEYTLSLEQRLISHCKYKLKDSRITNETQNPGSRSKQNDIGYAIYLVVEYINPGEHEDYPIIIIESDDELLGEFDDDLDFEPVTSEELALIQ